MIADYLITGLGAFFAIVGIYAFVMALIFLKRSTVITGKVVDHAEQNRGRRIYYYPVFEYQEEQTNKAERWTSSTAATYKRYQVGDTASLRYYNNGTETKLLENKWMTTWGSSFLMILLGLVFLAVGLPRIIH